MNCDRKGIFEWGVPLLLREPESVRQFTARYPGATRRTATTPMANSRFKRSGKRNFIPQPE